MSTQLIPPGKLFSELKHIGISNQPGNLLQMRDDGIYYGIQARPDLAALAIDNVRGNDNNPGTWDKPLRSLAEALKRIRNDNSPSSAIWLRENQEFTLDCPEVTQDMHFFNIPNTRLYFNTWTDNRIYQNIDQPYYFPSAAADFPRAKIRFKRRITNDRVWCFRDRISPHVVEARGIEFLIDCTSPPGSENCEGNFPGIFNVDRTGNFMSFSDCIFRFNGDQRLNNPQTRYRADALLRGKNIEWNHSILADHDRWKHDVIFYIRNQPSITVYADRVGEYIGMNGNRNFRTMIQSVDDLYRVFNLENIIYWSSFPNRASNYTPGITLNYNIFDYDKTHYL